MKKLISARKDHILDNIDIINKYCNVIPLVHFLRIAITRAFIQAAISFITMELLFLCYLNNQSEIAINALSSAQIEKLIFVPAYIGLCAFSIFILAFIWRIVDLFGNRLVDKTKFSLKHFESNYIEQELKKHPEKIFKIEEVQNMVYERMFILHVMGVCFYFGLCLGVGIYYLFYLKNSVDVELSYWFVLAFSSWGMIMGALWNFCDYHAEKRIDWLYIVSDTNLIELYKQNCKEFFFKKENEDKLSELIKEKKNEYFYHTILLIVVSLVFLGIIMCGPLHDIIFMDMSFLTNQYIVLYVTLAIFIYKYSYAYYYKTEKTERKIFPHFYDFKGI